MEGKYMPPQFEITNIMVYKTVQFTVKDKNGKTYYVSLAEHDWYDDWEIKNESGELVKDNDELLEELVFICQKQLEEGI